MIQTELLYTSCQPRPICSFSSDLHYQQGFCILQIFHSPLIVLCKHSRPGDQFLDCTNSTSGTKNHFMVNVQITLFLQVFDLHLHVFMHCASATWLFNWTTALMCRCSNYCGCQVTVILYFQMETGPKNSIIH